MSADFHLFLRLMIRSDCEFFRSAFVVLEAICPLTFVESQSLKPPQMILERIGKIGTKDFGTLSFRIPSKFGFTIQIEFEYRT